MSAHLAGEHLSGAACDVPGRATSFSFSLLNARDDSLDEVWPWFGEGQLKRGSELLTGAHADGWNAHAVTDGHEVKVRIGKIQ